MARISAITNDGKEQSKAEGNLKSDSQNGFSYCRQQSSIIINKNELDGICN